MLRFSQARSWMLRLGLGALLGLSALTSSSGCAYNATGSLPRRTLIFEASVAGGSLTMSNNLAYYIVLDTNGNPSDGPLVNGPAPTTFPFPDPRSYLPFVRDDQTAVLDQEPSYIAPPTFWSDYFWLTEESGQFIMWQGRRNADGTVNERFRQLQQGREWGIKDGKTIQITLPFNQLSNIDPNNPPAQIEGNLAVATRAVNGATRGWMIERWLSQVPNQYFSIQTRPITQTLYDTIATVPYPNNVTAIGVDPASVNFVSITYRVVFGD